MEDRIIWKLPKATGAKSISGRFFAETHGGPHTLKVVLGDVPRATLVHNQNAREIIVDGQNGLLVRQPIGKLGKRLFQVVKPLKGEAYLLSRALTATSKNQPEMLEPVLKTLREKLKEDWQ